jgi:hypothetical protein
MLIFEEKSLPSIRESKELLTVWFDYVIVWNHSEFVRTVVPCVSQDAVVTRRKKRKGWFFVYARFFCYVVEEGSSVHLVASQIERSVFCSKDLILIKVRILYV